MPAYSASATQEQTSGSGVGGDGVIYPVVVDGQVDKAETVGDATCLRAGTGEVRSV